MEIDGVCGFSLCFKTLKYSGFTNAIQTKLLFGFVIISMMIHNPNTKF